MAKIPCSVYTCQVIRHVGYCFATTHVYARTRYNTYVVVHTYVYRRDLYPAAVATAYFTRRKQNDMGTLHPPRRNDSKKKKKCGTRRPRPVVRSPHGELATERNKTESAGETSLRLSRLGLLYDFLASSSRIISMLRAPSHRSLEATRGSQSPTVVSIPAAVYYGRPAC